MLCFSPVYARAEPQALRVPGPLSPRNASYRIEARLDDKEHKVTGHQVLSWRNLESQPVDRLVFHLYQNAFKNFASTFIRDAGPELRGAEMPEHGFGAIDVTALRVGKDDLLARAQVDDTLMTVPLPQPVGAHAAVEVEMSFTVTLPRAFARSGWAGDFHAVAQWFPKIAVWDCAEGACRWRAHQYHGQSEFFADYGVYDVELDVPASARVGATGVLVDERVAGPPDHLRRRLRYHAEDVHDFVWMTDPAFVVVDDTVRDEWGQVAVRLLSRPGLQAMNPRHLQAVRAGLLELERRFGPYPYSNVTVVLPPADALGAGGMEYPTLFTSIPFDFPPGLHFAEDTTIHELGHQYFYGILGTDEVEEAWLDEGLNQTYNSWGLERLYPGPCNSIDWLGLCISGLDEDWLGYRSAVRRAPIATPSFELYPESIYAAVTYGQTAVTMRTLERYLGPARMEAAMRRYAERFRFRHPRRAEFVAAMSEGAGEDLRWFFDQALQSTRVADYAVLEVQTGPHRPAAGLWDCPPAPSATPGPEAQALIKEAQEAACAGKPAGKTRIEFDPEEDPRYRDRPPRLHDSEVVVWRRGDFLFPVSVLVTFADGATVRERWGLAEQQALGEKRLLRLAYPRRPAPLVKAEVDPDNVLLLDERRLNDGLSVQPERAPARRSWSRWLGAVQTLLDLLGP